ncbi:MAG TPA: DUF2149 domain-containing protein [Solirubrobacteraceae bacterium]|jgi:hypothetical protein|nr:DUF2149 domain-containing protein [Solirubrobacteraceae bacterium]
MTRHTGLGRHSGTREAVGDPLEGLVNLFDIGIVLAVAFLIAGLGLTLNDSKHTLQRRTPTTQRTQTLPSPAGAPTASGHGQPVGTVYRLSDGQLVYVQKQR